MDAGAGRPDWCADLLDEVGRAFEVTGAGTPGWPNPHPDLAPPHEEEYSRVTDPGKYRILPARIEAWAQVLTTRGLATSSEEPRSEWVGAGDLPQRDERVRRIDPARAGGLGLLVVGTIVDGAAYGIELGVVVADEAPVLHARFPVCGCDACDDGSAYLLDELDDEVLRVAQGEVVTTERRLRGEAWL